MSSYVKLKSRQTNRFPSNISLRLTDYITLTERFQSESLSLALNNPRSMFEG